MLGKKESGKNTLLSDLQKINRLPGRIDSIEKNFPATDPRYWYCTLCGKKAGGGINWKGKLYCIPCEPRLIHKDERYKLYWERTKWITSFEM